MTLTPALLNQARMTVVLVAGAEKADALRQILKPVYHLMSKWYKNLYLTRERQKSHGASEETCLYNVVFRAYGCSRLGGPTVPPGKRPVGGDGQTGQPGQQVDHALGRAGRGNSRRPELLPSAHAKL
ncbi:MAG: 6-phosphogluconolactonase [Deltaproteobacteria bacterium]|nr:6-phosphogluconolactonase [Deltaproteobacteria bacterium]